MKNYKKKLATKDPYSFIEISEFLPSQCIERYRWILELKLTFLICLYRYSQGNYLGNFNYVWRISESNSNHNEHETCNAQTIAVINENYSTIYNSNDEKKCYKQVFISKNFKSKYS